MNDVNAECTDWLVKLLDKRDPEGLIVGDNPGREYETEAPDIIAALRRAQSAEQFGDELYAIFSASFNGAVGSRDVYAKLAGEIYEQRHRLQKQRP